MLIQAHARSAKGADDTKRKHTFQFGGRLHTFTLNDAGHMVGEVTDPALIKRLLSLPEGYREYKPDATGSVEVDEGDEGADLASPFVLSIGDGDETVDLRDLNKADLVAFAKENELDIPAALNKADYAQAIVDALNPKI
jgi:hypothetical protein